MKTPSLSLCTLLAGCVGIAGCSQTMEPSQPQFTRAIDTIRSESNNPLRYAVLHVFSKAPDGNTPLAPLVFQDDTFYGTTEAGGSYSCGNGASCGTVFSITSSGVEQVLHSFGAANDGFNPASNLVVVGGLLYGTTEGGGAANSCNVSRGCGTVFSITTNGAEKVLYSFGKGADGSNPVAGLIDVNGTLYGTTSAGGAYTCSPFTCGTVFSITTEGKEKVLHSFGKGADGVQPVAGLIDVGGTLYGTTEYGGANGIGTVFSITTTGKEKVLHSFGTDGARPLAGLVDDGGLLYGTTVGGGACPYCGTVFSITKSGTVRVLHSFAGGTDGANPVAALVNAGGTLYGTTKNGGKVCGAATCGTVFSITTAGEEAVLHSFGGAGGFCGRGCTPLAGLTYERGRLFGTTSDSENGYGTVFSLKP